MFADLLQLVMALWLLLLLQEPPVGTLYHCKFVPVAVRFATVGLVLLQNVCGLVAVGNGVVVIVTVTGTSCWHIIPLQICSCCCKVCNRWIGIAAKCLRTCCSW